MFCFHRMRHYLFTILLELGEERTFVLNKVFAMVVVRRLGLTTFDISKENEPSKPPKYLDSGQPSDQDISPRCPPNRHNKVSSTVKVSCFEWERNGCFVTCRQCLPGNVLCFLQELSCRFLRQHNKTFRFYLNSKYLLLRRLVESSSPIAVASIWWHIWFIVACSWYVCKNSFLSSLLLSLLLRVLVLRQRTFYGKIYYFAASNTYTPSFHPSIFPFFHFRILYLQLLII